MWSLGRPEDPYEQSTESKIVKYAKSDGLTEEKILKILKDLEAHGLIHREEARGKVYIKYKVEAAKIVKELQKTTYVHSREHFTPPHH
jgi:predicted transcriptional regulator